MVKQSNTLQYIAIQSSTYQVPGSNHNQLMVCKQKRIPVYRTTLTTLGDKSTHPLGRISDPVSVKTWGAHTTKNGGFGTFSSRRLHRRIALVVFSTPSALSTNPGGVLSCVLYVRTRYGILLMGPWWVLNAAVAYDIKPSY